MPETKFVICCYGAGQIDLNSVSVSRLTALKKQSGILGSTVVGFPINNELERSILLPHQFSLHKN